MAEPLDARTRGTRWAGFVRNVMLGREGLSREVLVRIVEAAGGSDVRSHLTTGNVTFDAARPGARAIGRRTEAAVAAVLGRHEPVVLRELGWVQELLDDDPFSAHRDGTWELEVGMLPLDAGPLDPSRLPDPGRTLVLDVRAREVFTARPRDGHGRPHVVTLLEAATGARATARGWSTLQKIAAAGA